MAKRTFTTDRELKALKPAGRWYDVRDGHARNLIVRVGPENSKGEFRRTFCFVARFPGSKHPVRHALGEYRANGQGYVTLEEARETAAEWRKLIRQGVDPRGEKKRREFEQRQQSEEEERRQKLRFSAVVEEFFARHLKGKRSAAVVEREMRTEILPHWKHKLVTEITRADVVELVEAIADRPAPYQAHNIFAYIRVFFGWAIDRGKYGLEASPCDRLKPARLIGAKKPRQRVLNDDELRALVRAAGRLGYPFGPMFLLLAITGQRKSEVAEARWREFHPDLVQLLRERTVANGPIDWRKVPQALKVWTVPPERFKSDASHLVPLTDDALAVLETLPHFSSGDYVFSTSFGKKPVGGFSKAKARLDRQMVRSLKALGRARGTDPQAVRLEPFVTHDLRRTMRTRLSALKVSERVAEMVIGHGKKGLARVYDQHEFADEMREALDLWAGRLRDIVKPPPANVVPMRGRADG